MSIKSDELYPKYLQYLESQNLSKGALELNKISSSKFEEFKIRYKHNITFQEKIENLCKSIYREEKITVIMEDDFESFLDDLEIDTKSQTKLDEDFFNL